MDIKKEFGEKLKRMRKTRKLTQEQFAEIIGISPRNLCAIEVGANFVKAETLEKIIKALDTTTEELFANDNLQDSKTLVESIIKDVKSIENDRKKLENIYKMTKFIINS